MSSSAGELGQTRSRHLESVCAILESALKSACAVYAGLQAVRVQREVDFQKMSRLEFKARKGA